MAKSRDELLKKIADNTLSLFAKIAQSAAYHFTDRRQANPDVFAGLNTLNEQKAVRSLATVHETVREDLRLLAREPITANLLELFHEQSRGSALPCAR